MAMLENVDLFAPEELRFIEPAETNPSAYHAATAEALLRAEPSPPELEDVPDEDDPKAEASPAFPTHELPEPLQSMVRHAARQTNAPESLCAAAGLGVASASIGGGLRVRSGEGRETPANLYLLAFAHSGTGKGQSFNVMSAPWHEEGRRLMEEWQSEERPRLLAELETASADLDRGKRDRRANTAAEEAASAESTITEAVKRKAAAEDALAREPLLNIGNATAEAIAEALSHAPGEASAIISAEARDVVANLMGRYSKDGNGSDEAIFLQAYSGDAVIHKRKGRAAITIHSPCLTLCLAVQPDIWDRMAGDSRLMESGFLARAMAFNSHAPPVRPSRYSIPADVADAWRTAVRSLLHNRADPAASLPVIPSDGALRALETLAHESADNQGENGEWNWCRPFAARLAENAWRLALVFHAIRHAESPHARPLDEDTARAAVTVARWFFRETTDLLSPLRGKQTAARMDKLEAIFRDKRTDSLPLWKLAQNHGFREEEVRALAEEIPHRLEITTTTTGGRPSTLARLVACPFPRP